MKEKKLFTTNNIIVRMPNWIGDAVLASPVLIDLRKAFPKAEVTAMCTEKIAPLFEKDSHINELFYFHRSSTLFRRIRERSIVGKLKTGEYDLGILLTNSFSSAWLFWQGKVQQTIGFKKDARGLLLSHPISFPQKKDKEHLVTTYKRLLLPLGIPFSDTSPKLFLTKEEEKEAWQFVKRFYIAPEKKIITIHPGAAYGSAKCWPPDRFHSLAKRLINSDPHIAILFIGHAMQKSLIQKICTNLGEKVVDLSGKTNIRRLMALIKISSLLVTNDSGPMHIADSLGTPLVALFGSTDPIVTGPYRQKSAVIYHNQPCSPCFKRSCPIDFPCMRAITVEEVFRKIEQIYKK